MKKKILLILLIVGLSFNIVVFAVPKFDSDEVNKQVKNETNITSKMSALNYDSGINNMMTPDEKQKTFAKYLKNLAIIMRSLFLLV